MPIIVGTSGWHYPGGRGTWNGIFYPAPRPKGFDELAYYAERFDSVEVNATFYRQPDAAHALAWVRRTPATFGFAVKLFQKFTHPDMYLARPGSGEWDVTRGDLDVFRAGIDPIASAGRLLALLVQFPSSFHASDDTRAYMDWLLTALGDYALAVEVRHRSWSDDQTGTRALLDRHRAAWVYVDEPKFSSSIRQDLHGPTSRLVSELMPPHGTPSAPLSYIRLHGRNAAQWWAGESEERYDYLYSPMELAPFAEAAQQTSTERRGRVLIYLNNCFAAKSAANAALLRHQLGEAIPGDYPREMVWRYPDLAGVVTTAGLPL